MIFNMFEKLLWIFIKPFSILRLYHNTMWSSQDIKWSVYLFGLPSFVRIHCELQWQKNCSDGLHLFLNPNRNWSKTWDCRNGKRGRSTRPYLSSSHMKTQSDASITGLVTVTETVTERVQQPKEPAACRHFTLSRSRLLILSDWSLKSCNRVVTPKEGRRGRRLKLTVYTLSQHLLRMWKQLFIL